MFKRQVKTNSEDSSDTERRVLEAAGEVFADLGYRAATVRQICEKAGANIAAVNYYFGDKEGLYLAVLRSVPDAQAEKYPAHSGLSDGATAEQQLRAYVQSLLHRVFDAGRPGWHAKIIAREMVEPTRALDTLLEEVARPLHRELATHRSPAAWAAATDENVRMAAPEHHGSVCLLSPRSDGTDAPLPGTKVRRRGHRPPGGTYQQVFSRGVARICTQEQEASR